MFVNRKFCVFIYYPYYNNILPWVGSFVGYPWGGQPLSPAFKREIQTYSLENVKLKIAMFRLG